jgi:hypothetical protein
MALAPSDIAAMDKISGLSAAQARLPFDMDKMDAVSGLNHPSFMGTLANQMQGRFQNANDTLSSNDNLASKALQIFGNGMGTIGDVAGDIGGAAVGAVGDAAKAGINYADPNLIPSVENAVANSPTAQRIGSVIKNTANFVGNEYNKIVPEGTEARRDLGAVGDIVSGYANGIPVVKAGAPIVGAVKDAGGAIGGAISKGVGNLAKTIGASADDLALSPKIFDNASEAYAKAAQVGTSRSAGAVNDFLSQAVKNGSQNPQLLANQGPDAAQNYLTNKLLPFKDQPMSIGTTQALDIQLKEAANQAFKNGEGSLGTRYKAMQQALRDNVFNNPDPATLLGDDPSGFHYLQEGNRLYSMGSRAEDVENMIQKGLEKQVPSTAIQNQFSKLASKIRENGPMGFKPNEVAAIQKAAKSGVVAPLLRTMGSRLISPLVGASAGGVAAGPLGILGGEAAGYAAGAPFRAGATALAKGRGMKVLNEITNGGIDIRPFAGDISADEATQPMQLLPSPTSAQPMTDEQMQAARQNMNEPPPATSGLPLPEQVPAPRSQTTVRDASTGELHKAYLEPMGNLAQNEAFQKLPWAQQRAVAKMLPQYTNATVSKAEMISKLAKTGLSPRDANQILTELQTIKVWRSTRPKPQ